MRLFSSKLFWAAFALVSIASALLAFRFFGAAFPIVALDIEMDRAGALERARELTATHGWGPSDYRQAASFGLDAEVQNFVELEAGGKEAFKRLLKQELFSPYLWRVRHFRELTTNSTEIWFTPAGDPDGFRERLAEDDPGAALAPEAARQIAEAAATADWGVDLGAYEPVEQSQEARPGGRVDHTFVYESPLRDIGEGRYRLRLVVGGDRLVELARFVKVPEAFQRRYERMRSSNNTIGVVGSVAMAFLYIIGGCGVGLFLLMRQRWALWRKAVLWGVFLALLQALAAINQWPLLWMNYDTAKSYQGFFLEQISLVLVQFVVLALLLSVSLITAESLTRKAFPEHLRLWGLWSGGIANSAPALGRTVAGYLLVPMFFLYEVGLYFATSRTLGWWTPSDALVQPDVLANTFPWLTAIAVSAMAGFWEECLFRAIPLAGAALIGQRYGGRRFWIGGALLLQAVIFGAGHAPYPAQPAYARVAELILPSLFFGAIYLLYGLLPGIVLHFVFDVVWFAIPVFLSTAPGAWTDQAMIVALTLVPLLAVVGWRWRRGRWERPPESAYNRSWAPEPVQAAAEPQGEPEPPAEVRPFPSALKWWGLGAGVVGVALWATFGDFENPAGRLEASRAEALSVARQTLAQRGVQLPPPWRALARVSGGIDDTDRFVWSAAGPETYRRLLGSYLAPPAWQVRFARFEGDIEERAEQYWVEVSSDGQARRVRHDLPESRPAESIPEDQARQIALETVEGAYGLSQEQLKPVSTVASKLPARTDWRLVFADRSISLPEGEARILVDLAGSEVVDVLRSVHIPEEWTRQRRNRQTIATVIRSLCRLVIVLLLLAGLVGAGIHWSRRGFPVRTALALGGLSALLLAARYANHWPEVAARLSTAQPLSNQVLTVIVVALLAVVFGAGAIGMNAGFVQAWRREPGPPPSPVTAAAGFSIGLLATGVFQLAGRLREPGVPSWPDFDPLNSFLPILSTANTFLLVHLVGSVILLLTLVCVDRLSGGWRRRRILTAGAAVLAGMLAAGLSTEDPVVWPLRGLAAGVLLLAAYVLFFRFDLNLIPLAVAGSVTLRLLEQAWINPYPNAAPAAVTAAVLIAIQALLWVKQPSWL